METKAISGSKQTSDEVRTYTLNTVRDTCKHITKIETMDGIDKVKVNITKYTLYVYKYTLYVEQQAIPW